MGVIAQTTYIPLPARPFACDVCDRMMNSAQLGCCSTCQNRFWCTPACQATDVKKHYFDCSPLAGPSSAYPIAPVELDAIVKHVSIPLLQWNNAVVYAQQRGQRVAPHSAGAKAICDVVDQLSAHIRCHDPILAANVVYPFRQAIVNLSRLYLLHFVARRPSGATARLTRAIDTFSRGISRHPLHAAKILTRPADLSPGEYAALVHPMLTVVTECPDNMETMERWTALWTALDELWEVKL